MALRCEMCGRPNRSKKDRFCPEHENQMRRRMIASGYLEPLPRPERSGERPPREDGGDEMDELHELDD